MESTAILPEKRTFTPQEVADIMRVSRQTVYNWFDDGTLPYFKIGPRIRRVRRDDLLVIISITD